jgi:Methyltransferase domain
MDGSSKPLPDGPNLTLARLKRLAERHPALGFSLIPIRLKIALSYYVPGVGAVARWLVRSREYTNFTYDYSPASLEYLAHGLALVTGCPVGALRAYLAEPTENVELNRTVRERSEASDRRAVIDRDVRLGKQRVWYALARALKPARVVEAGVGPGLAAVVLAEALLENAVEGNGGEYLGIDRDPRAGALLGPRQRSVARIIYGESVSTLGGLGQSVDLFITDSHVSPDVEYAECRAIEPWLTERAVVGTTVTTRLPAFAEETGRVFLGFKEEPRDHWYPGQWIGLAYRPPPSTVAR